MKRPRCLVVLLLLVSLTLACNLQEGLKVTIAAPSPTTTPTSTPTVTPSPTSTSTPTPVPTQPVVWSDGRIEMTLDEVERANVLPLDISPPGNVPTPAEGHDYVCVYLTIARIENVHVVNPLGHGDQKSTLRDAESHRYEVAFGQVRGIEFLDPHDITGPSEVVEGATGILVFEIPKHQKPANLTFVYSFQETWEEISPKRGQIDISL